MTDTEDEKRNEAWDFLHNRFEGELEELNDAFYHILNTEGPDVAAAYADDITEHLRLASDAAVIVGRKDLHERINEMLTQKIAELAQHAPLSDS